jgi:hypothetical protein
MVEDRITDGRRIAQLLASELTGLETGPLAAVSVTDADPDAEPSADGTVAYTIAHGGERVGIVRIYPERVVVTLGELEGAAEQTVVVDSGAAVKRAVDRIREALTAAVDG